MSICNKEYYDLKDDLMNCEYSLKLYKKRAAEEYHKGLLRAVEIVREKAELYWKLVDDYEGFNNVGGKDIDDFIAEAIEEEAGKKDDRDTK